MKKITEKNFVSQLKKGNDQAMEYVIDNYGSLLKSVIWHHLSGFPHMREDCLQEALFAIWQNIDKYNPRVSSFKNWAAAVAKYKAIDLLRKHSKELQRINIEDTVLTEENLSEKNLIDKEIQREISDLFNILDKKEREIFYLFYFDEKTASEIADATGLSQNTIYKRLSRGRAKLRKEGFCEK